MNSDSPSSSNSRRTPIFVCENLPSLFSLVLAIALLAALPGLDGGYFGDDGAYVFENAKLQHLPLSELWRLLSPVELFNPYEWLPLRDMVYRLEFGLFGYSVIAYKVVQLLSFIAASVASLWFAKAVVPLLTDDERLRRLLPWLAASLYVLHPTHVESAQAIANLKDTLSTIFGFSALAIFARAPQKPTPRTYTNVNVLLGLALASKGASVAFTGLLWLIAYAKADANAIGKRLWQATVTAIPAVLVPVALFLIFLRTSLVGMPIDEFWIDRIVTVIGGQAYYALVAYPVSWFYAPYGEMYPVYFSAGIGSLVVVAVCAVQYLRRPGLYCFGALFFAVALLPYVQITPFQTMSMISDRFVFVSLFGMTLAAGTFLLRQARMMMFIGGTALLLCWVGLYIHRSLEWRNPHKMIKDDIARHKPFQHTDRYKASLGMVFQYESLISRASTNNRPLTGQEYQRVLSLLATLEANIYPMQRSNPDMAALWWYSNLYKALDGYYRNIVALNGEQPDLALAAARYNLRRGRATEAREWAAMFKEHARSVQEHAMADELFTSITSATQR